MESKRETHHSGLRQSTLKESVSARGIGLHTGRRVEMAIEPAPADTGIVFERADLPGKPSVTACPRAVVRSALCTALQNNGTRVSTVEHVLAALYGLGVDNARVVLSGEEVPILDGSALPFVRLLQEGGLRSLDACRSWLRVVKPVTFSEGDRTFRILPARRLSIECTVDFDHPLVTDQQKRYEHDPDDFQREIAPARTFGFLKDVGEMQRAGLVRGGSLDNAVVIDSFSILNPGGLRFPDEFVRHKVLDILGDLALLGGALAARVEAYKSGHRLHHAVVRRLVRDPDCCMKVQVQPNEREKDLPFDLAPFRLPGLQRA
jgi:UDP-3-O-[3-hydroxymyristoyl] N-acetylglucosamine deacetylase